MSTTYTFGPGVDLEKRLLPRTVALPPSSCVFDRPPLPTLFGIQFSVDPRLPANVWEIRDAHGHVLQRGVLE